MWVEIGTATMENSMEVSQKTKTEPPYNPEIPLLGIHPETKTLIWKDVSFLFFSR